MLFIYDGVFVLGGFYPSGVLFYGAFVHGGFVLGEFCPTPGLIRHLFDIGISSSWSLIPGLQLVINKHVL